VQGGGADWGGSGFLNCAACWKDQTDEDRQGLACGWLPRLPGVEPVLPMGAPRPACGTCPGYLVSLPQVGQALHAHLWWDKGQLRDLVADAEVSPLLRGYVDAVSGAVAELELERETERERERRRLENQG
jgi:hypothetical protein